jgi:hypothetical protein
MLQSSIANNDVFKEELIFWGYDAVHPLKVNRYSRETCRPHLQGPRISEIRNKREKGSNQESNMTNVPRCYLPVTRLTQLPGTWTPSTYLCCSLVVGVIWTSQLLWCPLLIIDFLILLLATCFLLVSCDINQTDACVFRIIVLMTRR